MARVVFTPNLQRHVICSPAQECGAIVREVQDTVFAENPKLRGCVLDDTGALRRHVVVFVEGLTVRDRRTSSDAVPSGVEVCVFCHGLDVDASGEVLAFGSTTGSLWDSEDAGARWQRLSAELPPVHAARFGAQTA